ncbi:hypothetical protein B0H13DRAFT_1597766 [Mycena leptocephala]|nr:hypothetical protein B0H13DRAFT_1597766 [Mycena leptocephala]
MVWKNVYAIIDNKLYLKNLVAVRSTRSLTERRITHVLSVCTDTILAELPQPGIQRMRVPIEDVDYADLLIHLPSVCQFIDHAIRSVGAILVHDVQAIQEKGMTLRSYFPPRLIDHVVDTQCATRSEEQLILFERCQYQATPSNRIYRSWRSKLDRRKCRDSKSRPSEFKKCLFAIVIVP